MSRFEAIGNFVYEKGERIGCTVGEANLELARKLNAYQMRIERLKAVARRFRKFNNDALAHIAKEERKSRERLDMEQAENERLQAELKFAEHRMICLAEALADTRLGYQKEIELLKKGRTNPKRDQEALKKADKGKPSRSGGKGEIIGDKPQESGGTY